MRIYDGTPSFLSETGSEGAAWILDRRRPTWRKRLEAVVRFPRAVAGLCRNVREEWRRGRKTAVSEAPRHFRRILQETVSPSLYADVVLIEEGDRLMVYDADGEEIFSGLIDPDEEAGWHEYPLNPGYGQPSALGFWIHWTQRGWEPDAWARLFLREILPPEEGGGPPYRAELWKR